MGLQTGFPFVSLFYLKINFEVLKQQALKEWIRCPKRVPGFLTRSKVSRLFTLNLQHFLHTLESYPRELSPSNVERDLKFIQERKKFLRRFHRLKLLANCVNIYLPES